MSSTSRLIPRLLEKGIHIPRPDLVEIDEAVSADRFEPGDTVIHPGARIQGSETLILAGTRIGEHGPAVLHNVATGRGVLLGAGFFAGCVLLDGAQVRSGAEIRQGTIIEEEARVAHCVGLKQTILMPFATLGSLINFCDCLLAGGTGPRDHSEVGSGFIHFNFTPFGDHGDKATPSLFGDVPDGVLLDSPRIFLGGSAAVVGPATIGYGSVLAAGTVYRRDYGANLLVKGERFAPATGVFDRHVIRGARRKFAKNLRYTANLIALWHWYKSFRLPLASGDPMLELLYGAGLRSIESSIAERVERTDQFVGYLNPSPGQITEEAMTPALREEHADVCHRWPTVRDHLRAFRDHGNHDPPASSGVIRSRLASSHSYPQIIRSLSPKERDEIRSWLHDIVEFYDQSPALAGRPP